MADQLMDAQRVLEKMGIKSRLLTDKEGKVMVCVVSSRADVFKAIVRQQDGGRSGA